MMYLLDFDRTLFDTEAFYEFQKKNPSTKDFFENPSEDLANSLAGLIEEEKPFCEPGELKQFLYADVPEFLRMLGNEATIVTYGNPVLQRFKVENATMGIPRVSALYTGDLRKGEFLKDRIGSYGTNVIFVDDEVIGLDGMTKYCPNVRLFEMRRDKAEGDGRWPVIRSLTELP